MLAPVKIKMRAFVQCIKEDGVDRFIEYLQHNEQNGVVYHRDGVFGDYDLKTEEQVLQVLRGIK